MTRKVKIDFSGRVAAISGGASGIGLAVAQRLADGGATVCLWDIDEAALIRAKAQICTTTAVVTERLDVTNPDDVSVATDLLVRQFGTVDILVTSAGITGPNHKAWEYPIDAWNKVMRVNIDGVMHCCRSVIPYMLRNKYGRIATIASIGGKEGNPNASAYAASKGAVVAFTKAIGKELAHSQVRVNTICPAAIETELLKQMRPEFVEYMKAKIPMGRLGLPDEVASLVAWMCSEECSFCTGAVFDSSGGRATY